ncbi:hypothetical protein [Citrobacter freundii]|uniref:hypothetical protein n=1 Tax=Citrobacter freundii TaxID=546 RepID=UPI003977E75D
MVRKFSEFESNLSESKREFRAADATIHNLELKLTDMAVQLANAESKCRELAAENVTLNEKMNKLATWPGIEFYSSAWVFCNLDGSDALEFMCDVKTTATDAFLAEVRASAIPDEATERDLFEEWVMEKIFISKTTLEGLRTDDGYRNSTLSGTDYNGMWSQWKAIRAAQLRQEAAQ